MITSGSFPKAQQKGARFNKKLRKGQKPPKKGKKM